LQATGAVLLVPYWCTVLADIADHLGHPADGLQALAEGHTLVEQYDLRWWEAEVCRLRGVLLLRQAGTAPAEAEAWFQRALDVARRQEAKSLELRAAVSLARLWQRQGKRAEARELLAPVYGWFTEGFDTADLQEAKALVAYPLAADNVLRPLPCPLIGGDQPVMRTRNRFSRPRPALLACNGTHLGRSTLRCSTPAGS
jgi:hypothetical protein